MRLNELRTRHPALVLQAEHLGKSADDDGIMHSGDDLAFSVSRRLQTTYQLVARANRQTHVRLIQADNHTFILSQRGEDALCRLPMRSEERQYLADLVPRSKACLDTRIIPLEVEVKGPRFFSFNLQDILLLYSPASSQKRQQAALATPLLADEQIYAGEKLERVADPEAAAIGFGECTSVKHKTSSFITTATSVELTASPPDWQRNAEAGCLHARARGFEITR